MWIDAATVAAAAHRHNYRKNTENFPNDCYSLKNTDRLDLPFGFGRCSVFMPPIITTIYKVDAIIQQSILKFATYFHSIKKS